MVLLNFQSYRGFRPLRTQHYRLGMSSLPRSWAVLQSPYPRWRKIKALLSVKSISFLFSKSTQHIKRSFEVELQATQVSR